ncbi:cupin domain-containing protein [Candidatus Burkholderia verschuerenii]|uniref:cupin domain-containing protein n=1 Tax=Candidatus Burkholderia verschuerenii TaxID=242163 RepID=UPI00067E60D5|nr:cupin domain-containing protein [Candidatus Burkholderia verschuerenii]
MVQRTVLDENTVGSCFLDPASLKWEGSEVPGFETVTLFENRSTGESTMLMKVAPGAYAASHSHELLEEIFVFDGEFADDENRYRKGQYCIRAAGTPHTAFSDSGCTVLLVYRPASG